MSATDSKLPCGHFPINHVRLRHGSRDYDCRKPDPEQMPGRSELEALLADVEATLLVADRSQAWKQERDRLVQRIRDFRADAELATPPPPAPEPGQVVTHSRSCGLKPDPDGSDCKPDCRIRQAREAIKEIRQRRTCKHGMSVGGNAYCDLCCAETVAHLTAPAAPPAQEAGAPAAPEKTKPPAEDAEHTPCPCRRPARFGSHPNPKCKLGCEGTGYIPPTRGLDGHTPQSRKRRPSKSPGGGR